jgi:two-component system chemotaxis response regulator CheB
MKTSAWKAVVIGGSAGSLEALSAILPELPPDFPLPIFVVVHVPADKESVLAEVLQVKSRLRICEAQDKEPIEAGTVYFAPPDYHLLIEADGHLTLSFDEQVLFSRPSIDVLFESAADAYGGELVGIVLSGANQDGARGLKSVAAEGGTAVVQNPETAQSETMPAAALALCPSARILDPTQIAEFLKGLGIDES